MFRATLRAHIACANSRATLGPKLRPELFATVRIPLTQRDGSLRVASPQFRERDGDPCAHTNRSAAVCPSIHQARRRKRGSDLGTQQVREQDEIVIQGA